MVQDLRRELDHIHRKGTEFVQSVLGETVVWWEYDALLSEYDAVYDESSATNKRVWRPGILVPVQYVNVNEGGRTNEHQGRLTTNDLRLAVSIRVLRDVGLSNPQDNRRHLNDMILYQKKLWSLDEYDIRGRLARDSIMVAVTATEIKPDDVPFDTLPTFAGVAFTDRPMGFPSSSYEDQTFNNHELPAYHFP